MKPGVATARHVCLIVMDGWGVAPPGPSNAISRARTPTFDALSRYYPHTELHASGEAVGLPAGQMGNSEVGHMTIGAGSAVPQTLTLIDRAVAAGELRRNAVLRTALTAAPRVHLVGLVSDGGVHSSISHLIALVKLAAQLSVKDLVVHCFTDGRDTPPSSAPRYVEHLQQTFQEVGVGRVASVTGRFWAMDRDNRWDRTQAAYDAIAHGSADHHAEDPRMAIQAAYARGESDEFITPTLVGDEGRVGPQDSVLCFNFRPDRIRQIVRALAEPALQNPAPAGAAGTLSGWRGRGAAEPVRRLTTMTEYERGWPYPVAFEAAHPPTTLGAELERVGATQLHVAETEKYAHVTYFFNGGREDPYGHEHRVLVPSQRDIPTYDLKPQMSAREVTTALIDGLAAIAPQFAVVNLANADMVGHTGAIEATIEAIETVDGCLERITSAVHKTGGVCVITADHGNAEQMLAPDGGPNTTHSCNPVPLIVTAAEVKLSDGGTLADVAPTVLDLLGLEAPESMTGRSLLVEHDSLTHSPPAAGVRSLT